ncbi:FKBP-type peptidyl-prolyl cis-trans isomerase [Streptomyces sp. NPDC127084]|uniref:FKBP-type peptidyl-prolyl cis-trans isomerase n=1 Tax=Streptomyces sp. NPDC127084 TaxID=3347133 RepID=UPI0036659C32
MPTVTPGKGAPPPDLTIRTLVKGSGSVVRKNDFAKIYYLGQVWNAKRPFDINFDEKQQPVIRVGAGQITKGLDQSLEGQRVGSRILVTLPPRLAYGNQGYAPHIPPKATLIFVVDILNAVRPAVAVKGGLPVAMRNHALPAIKENPGGPSPSIEIPEKSTPPKNLVSKYVIEGNGPIVGGGDPLILAYKTMIWETRKTINDTYSQSMLQVLAPNRLFKGLQLGLIGKKVGSRVMLVVPPAFGMGKQESIPADATLVLSVDILSKI